MNKRDQELIAEAYVKVLEKAPQGMLSRMYQGAKSSLINKASNIPILGYAFAGAKERIESSAEAQQQVNKAKAQFETLYRQKMRKKYSDWRGAEKQFVMDFIKNVVGANINDPALTKYFNASVIKDRDINEAITVAYAVKQMGGGKTTKKPKRREPSTPQNNHPDYDYDY